MKLSAPFRRAAQEDAAILAELVNYAGEGLPEYLWGHMAGPGEDAWSIGRTRAARDEGSFSYVNATLIETAERDVAGALIGYKIADEVPPVPDDIPAMFRPLQELENLAPGTWYVNVLAVQPQFRGQGHGTRLLGLADAIGRSTGRHGMSVIVSDANHGARALYERCGYQHVSERPMVKEGWLNDGKNWVLLTKIF
ncbi:MAG: GNAT family N-acetyltransferase [Hyphomicrobiaceae bacterium]